MKNALNNPAGNYMFQVCQWCCSCTFIVNFEIFHSSSVSIVNFEHVIAGWEAMIKIESKKSTFFLTKKFINYG